MITQCYGLADELLIWQFKQPSVYGLWAQQYEQADLMWPSRAGLSYQTQLQYLLGCSTAHLYS